MFMTIDEYRELAFKNKMTIDDFLNHQSSSIRIGHPHF